MLLEAFVPPLQHEDDADGTKASREGRTLTRTIG